MVRLLCIYVGIRLSFPTLDINLKYLRFEVFRIVQSSPQIIMTALSFVIILSCSKKNISEWSK